MQCNLIDSRRAFPFVRQPNRLKTLSMNTYRCLTLLLICMLVSGKLLASNASPGAANDLEQFNRDGDFSVLLPHVVEQRVFYGLASYYNGLSFYKVNNHNVETVEPDQPLQLVEGEWFAVVGRFYTVLLNSPGTDLVVETDTLKVLNKPPLQLNAQWVRKDRLKEYGEELDQLRYYQLWWPFAALARAVEWSLLQLKALSGFGWGMTIVLFTCLLKVLMVPLSIVTARMQREVSQHQSQLAPLLAEIKSKYDGEEAHKRIMAAHKELGISTFFSLKPMLLMFVQVPIWIAVFNALGEMPQLANASFLWIHDLAYPDSIASLPLTLPLFGNSVSLLPWLMTAVTVLSTLLLRDLHAPADELKRQKRNLYLMGLAFFILFYPFPAAMVLYWTLSNALQIVQQRLLPA